MENKLETITEQQNEINGEDKCLAYICSFQNTESAALAYAKSGLSVIPVNQDKSPAIPTLDSVKKTIATEQEIKQWYAKSNSGIGVLCGTISGNVECLDIDEKHNIDPISLLNQLVPLVENQVPGIITHLVHETSINNGHHFVYRCSTIDRSKKLARRKPTDEELKEEPKIKSITLIETRGEGGYFVSYPSPGYKLVNGSFTDIPEITEQEREILLSCIQALNQINDDNKIVTGYPKRRSASMARPGDDFNQRGDIRPVLEEAGWKYVYSSNDIQYWRRPGKTDGISASFGKFPNMFYVFSSNADPLQPETWYTKFALLSLLKYNGDFRSAAIDLTEEQYGDSLTSKAESFLNDRYEFRFNLITGRTEYKSKDEGTFTVMEEYDLNSVTRELQLSQIPMCKRSLSDLLSSDFSAPFDPFREYYERLPKWDGQTDYISQLASTVTLKESTDEKKKFFDSYLRKWLVAAVGCAIEPEVVNHTCLTLVGPQGRYKTTWLNRLIPTQLSEYIHIGTIDPANKDTQIHLSECFLINLDELETLHTKELGTLKSIMTYKSSRLRRPYGYFANQMIRRASFVGSINRDSFLTDETGTRRFLVVEIETINTNHTVDMDKVHSQAYQLFKSGYRYWFDKDETMTVNKRNEDYLVQSTEDELVAQFCASISDQDPTIEWFTATNVADRISELVKYPIGKASARDFGHALRKAGFPMKKLNGLTRYAVNVAKAVEVQSSLSDVNVGVSSGVVERNIAEINPF